MRDHPMQPEWQRLWHTGGTEKTFHSLEGNGGEECQMGLLMEAEDSQGRPQGPC